MVTRMDKDYSEEVHTCWVNICGFTIKIFGASDTGLGILVLRFGTESFGRDASKLCEGMCLLYHNEGA
jgi:hypothetical protein